MKQTFETLNELEETRSGNEKKEIIKQAVNQDERVKTYFEYTLGDKVFNVGKKTIRKALNINYDKDYKDIGLELEKYCDEGTKTPGLGQIGNDANVEFEDFIKILDKLENITKESKQIELIKKIFNNVDPVEAKWYGRTLVKDLNCGVRIKTVNKVLKNIDNIDQIQTFEVSLATAIEMDSGYMDELEELSYPVYGEPKRDGVRLIIRNVDSSGEPLDRIEAKTRNGKKVFIVDNILDEIEESIGDRLFSLDGEIVGPDFQKLMTQLRRKENYDEDMDIEFTVFDIRYLDGDLSKYTQEERYGKLRGVPFNEMDCVSRVDHRVLGSPNEVVTYFNEVKNMFEEEGGMIKEPNAQYTNDRHHWYKLKPVETLDLEIVDYEIAEDGEYMGMLGAVTVSDKTGTIETKVGSGFTEDQREKYAEMGDELIGKIIEVNYDSMTQAQDSDKYALRFPRFISMREDKNNPNKVTKNDSE
jgi:DNA ligase-1